MLPDSPVRRRKSETGSLSGFLGGEKRLKNLFPGFAVYPAPRIGDGYHDITSFVGFGMLLLIGFIYLNIAGLYSNTQFGFPCYGTLFFTERITGVYQHVSQQHLKRYLAEFDFRYNERSGLGVTDAERAAKALKGIVGKRLTYRRTSQAGHA